MDRVLERSAFDRVVRTLVFSVGLGGVLFSLLGVGSMIEQYQYLDEGYSIALIGVYCGLPLVMASIAFKLSPTLLRALAGFHATSAVVLLALWVPAMGAETTLPGAQMPWLINVITVAACMAAIALPFLSAWVFLFSLATLVGFVRYITYGGGDASIAFQDAVMMVLLSGFMVALLQLSLRAGREQDAAAHLARTAAAENAANETLERQRTRYHAFTHDDVLATLLSASQDGPRPSEITRRSAQRTLEKLDQFRLDLPAPTFITLAELDAHLRTAATAARFHLNSSLTVTDSADLVIPVEAADALTEALAEAMRNSNRHGGWSDGRRVHREAHASVRDSTVQITVSDDGRGFNPRRVSIDRLGVRLSILQRVNSQPGGEASIRSAKGMGTTVQLRWSAPVEGGAR